MKHKAVKHKTLLAILLSGFTVCTLADGIKDIKPGLWEIQHKTAVDGQALPDMNKMLEQVPPEMRGQVEAMMAKNGAGMTDKGGITICITPEQIAKQQYGTDPKSQCKVTDIKNEDDTTHMKMQCSKPKGEGETTITRQSSEAWTSITHMTMDEQGSHTLNSESAAKWLGSDCGAVKSAGAKTTAE